MEEEINSKSSLFVDLSTHKLPGSHGSISVIPKSPFAKKATEEAGHLFPHD